MPPLLNPAAAAATAPPPPATATLVFSYGALMADSVLARRGVQPLASEPAVVEDAAWCLSFRHRGGYATLLRCQGPPLEPAWRQPHGVLHALVPADLERIAAREVGYRLAPLQVRTYGGEARRAAAFVSAPLLQLYRPVPPPRRYLDLLLEGGRQHGLEGGYLAWLASLDACEGSLDARYDACPADALAKLLAAGAAATAAAWATRGAPV